MRIHILGAPGAGVTTFGKALAEKLQLSVFDTDDYYWFTDDALPYRRKRNPDHRRKMLSADLALQPGWVLSGSLCGWGDVFTAQFDLAIYLWLPGDIRLTRIKARETARYGEARIRPGGDLHTVFEKFLLWADAYHDPSSDNIRSRNYELAWLKKLDCPVLEIREQLDLNSLVDKVIQDHLHRRV